MPAQNPPHDSDAEDDTPVSPELSGLIEKVTDEHSEEGAAAMADQLRGQVEETVESTEQAGDIED